MRPLSLLLLYLLAIFVGGALLAPAIYHLVQWLATHNSSLQTLAHKPFHRYLNRAMLIIAIVGVALFFRKRGNRLAAWGNQKRWKTLIQGFLIGFVSFACLALFTIFAGARKINLESTFSEIVLLLGKTVLTAGAVSLLEEIVFRRGIFGWLRRPHGFAHALVFSSALFAIVHFFARPADPDQVFWSSGFATLGQMFYGFSNTGVLIPGFLNLVMAGMVLGLAYERSGQLAAPIGIHAGWVVWLKLFDAWTVGVPGNNSSLWGSRGLINGNFALVNGWSALFILICVYLSLYHRKCQNEYQSTDPNQMEIVA